jgi:hypothetical protein
MGHDKKSLTSAINRIDAHIDVQWGRMGLLQHWLDQHSQKLDSLSAKLDANMARLDALLGGKITED